MPIRIPFFPGLFGAVFLLATHFCAAEERIRQVEEHFKWGEYDSLATKLESLMSESPEMDDRQKAQLHLYLGVAHYNQGKATQSRQEFIQAFRLHHAISLDSFYVSADILDHFTTAVNAEKYRMGVTEKPTSPISLVSVAPVAAPPPAMPVIARPATVRHLFSTRNLAMAGISLAMVGAAVAVYEYERSEKAHAEFLQAARVTGDPEDYRVNKRKVRTSDRRAIAAGSVSMLLLGTSGYLLWPGGDGNSGVRAGVSRARSFRAGMAVRF